MHLLVAYSIINISLGWKCGQSSGTALNSEGGRMFGMGYGAVGQPINRKKFWTALENE